MDTPNRDELYFFQNVRFLRCDKVVPLEMTYAGSAALSAAAMLLLSLGSSRAQSPTPPPLQASTCYPEYQSVFHFVDSTKTTEYSYDLRTLCGVDRWFAYPIPSNPSTFWNFYFAIGGNLSRQTFSCNPV